MKQKQKQILIQALNHNLKGILPNVSNIFLCPTCLKNINTSQKEYISIAHIIPKQVDSKLFTFLCKRCNTDFGAKIDKWFGDYLKTVSSKKHFLSTTTPKGHFLIDGMKVNGHIKQDNEGNVKFYMNTKLNSPTTVHKIHAKFDKNPSEVNIAVPLPLLENQKNAQIGFLNAGYLMWFKTFGYSWVLQGHLDIVRRQIMNPHEDIIKTAKYFYSCNDVDWKPWIGVIKIIGMHLPCFGIKNNLIVFPSRSHNDAYEKIEEINCEINSNDIRIINFDSTVIYGQPTVLVFENELVVATDYLPKLQCPPIGILLSDKFNDFKILRPSKPDEQDIFENEEFVYSTHF